MYIVRMITDDDGFDYWIVTNGENVAAWDFLTRTDAEDYAAEMNMELS